MSQSNVVVPPAAPAEPSAAAPVVPVVAPVAVAPPVVAAAPAVTPAAPAATDNVPADEPNWLKPRLQQAKSSGASEVLRTLGVKNEAEAKALLDQARAVAEAQKTEQQKMQERLVTLEAQAARVTSLEATVTARAAIELGQLTDAQKAAVVALAGTDPAKTLSTIDALKPTWGAPVAAVAQAPAVVATAVPSAPAPAQPPVAPATTSPPANAPGSAPTSPPDRKAEYAALKEKNPQYAAAYLNKYGDEIYPRA